MISATLFIEKVKIPLQQHWGYIWGTWGRMWTITLQKAYSQSSKTNWKKTKLYGSQWIGRMVADCSGLIRWACHELGEQVSHSSHYLYTDYCHNKGKLINGLRADNTQPLPGSLVFLTNNEKRKHHVGVYIGDNIVIEAKGTQWGVVTSDLKHWDSWGQLKCVDYSGVMPEQFINTSDETITQKAITINPGSYLNLRQADRKSAPVVTRIPRNTQITVLNTINPEWWKIQYNGHIGYAASEYLKLI